MTENEYIKATNRAKVSAALSILRNVLGGADYGISEQDIDELTSILRHREEVLFSSYKLSDGD